MTSSTQNGGLPPSPTGPLPIFYREPQVLNPVQHGSLRLKPTTDMRYAARTNSIPVTAEEFLDLSGSYPIVFAEGETPMPVAIVGLRQDQNLFVDKAGKWDPAHPIPGYVNRYPFIFLEQPEQDRLSLCVDRAAPMVSESDGELLFGDDTRPTAFARKVLQVCESYQRQLQSTRAFCTELASRGLFKPKQIEVKAQDGTKLALTGFMTIDDQAVRDLPDEVVVDWFRRGFLTAITTHQVSQRRWVTLLDKLNARKAKAA